MRTNPMSRTGSRFQTRQCGKAGESAFTLIELLIVIAIIAILAALIFPVTAAVNRTKMRAKARAELAQAETAIETYKAKLGHYPPDNPGRPSTNQLYFELVGTTNVGTVAAPVYMTLDGAAKIAASQMITYFGSGNVAGFVNCTPPGGGDEGRFASTFIHDLKPGQYAILTNNASEVRYLISSVPSPNSGFLGTQNLTPINYNSSSPTNNPGTYDLWIDIPISGKTNRICNWNRNPIVLP